MAGGNHHRSEQALDAHEDTSNERGSYSGLSRLFLPRHPAAPAAIPDTAAPAVSAMVEQGYGNALDGIPIGRSNAPEEVAEPPPDPSSKIFSDDILKAKLRFLTHSSSGAEKA